MAAAKISALTYDATYEVSRPFAFSNVFMAYRLGTVDVRMEVANPGAFYEESLGRVVMSMGYLLLSWYMRVGHLVTLRSDGFEFLTDRYWSQGGEAIKAGLSNRLRIDDPMVLKTRSPQFFLRSFERGTGSRRGSDDLGDVFLIQGIWCKKEGGSPQPKSLQRKSGREKGRRTRPVSAGSASPSPNVLRGCPSMPRPDKL